MSDITNHEPCVTIQGIEMEIYLQDGTWYAETQLDGTEDHQVQGRGLTRQKAVLDALQTVSERVLTEPGTSLPGGDKEYVRKTPEATDPPVGYVLLACPLNPDGTTGPPIANPALALRIGQATGLGAPTDPNGWGIWAAEPKTRADDRARRIYEDLVNDAEYAAAGGEPFTTYAEIRLSSKNRVRVTGSKGEELNALEIAAVIRVADKHEMDVALVNNGLEIYEVGK